MLIGHFKIHFWFNCLFATALAGAFFPRYDFSIVLLITLGVSTLSLTALGLSWKNRTQIEKLKLVSENIAVAGLSVFLFMLFVDTIVSALLWFTVFIQIALNLTFKEKRQLYYGLLVSFVFLCAGAAESKTGLYLVFIILYCIFASVCLGYYYMDRRIQKNQGSAQRMNWPVINRIQVSVSLIVISSVIYLLMPRFTAGNFGNQFSYSDTIYGDKTWESQADKGERSDESGSDSNTGSGSGSGSGSGPGPGPGSDTRTATSDNTRQQQANNKPSHDEDSSGSVRYQGFNDNFDIRGEVNKGGLPANAVVAYCQAEHGSYLRVETFDLFDGVSWEKSIKSDTKKKLKHGSITLLENEDANFRQNMSIVENLGAYIPAASIPVELSFPATVISVDQYQMIKIPSGLTKGTRYTVDSSIKFIDNRLFSGTHYHPRKNDLQLPPGFDERIRDLSQSLTKNATTELGRATLLESHLRENYEYSLASVFNSQNRTPVEKFLFEDKKGHCEYFASSLAVMLRSLNIPARLVTGFSATTRNPLTGYHEIRVLDGHAWVEAWVDNKGWAVLEPTPFYTPPAPPEDRLAAEAIESYVEQLQQFNELSEFDSDLSLELLLTSLWQSISTLFVVIVSYIKLFIVNSWRYLVGAVVIFFAMYMLWHKWKPSILARLSYYQVISYKPGDQKTDVRFYLRHIQQLLDTRGLSRLPGTTIEQYTRQIVNFCTVELDMELMIELVNNTHYDTVPAADIDASMLRQVFIDLYKPINHQN